MVILGLAYQDPYTTKMVDYIDPKILFKRNKKNENVIIVSTKLGHHNVLNKVLEKIPGESEKEKYINTLDHHGNTALHYAILLKDKYVINLLMKNKADPTLKNLHGLTAIDLAKQCDDSEISEIIAKPRSTIEMETQMVTQKLKSAVKGKSTDEKVDDYIKNYRITAYQQEYDYLKNNKFFSIYSPSPNNITVQKWHLYMYYFEYFNALYDSLYLL
ncbi:hypothetical protein PIROE2DRAFT_62711 [Piromyces sp. E2]|nr:hypothetical protein PIROE2DRAFT_62711 [Piromyces sp. E2]|eukprot:OUM61122.1 hypothetical protein PIROE2DRAFT_62711 [Piromyces sp. E2]